MDKNTIQFREYTVLSAESTSPTAIALTLKNPDPPKPLPYKPGQYATLSFLNHNRPTMVRCFSFSSSPADPSTLQFAISTRGVFSKVALRSLQPGEKVTVEGPFGDFIFDEKRDQSALMLASGLGVTPFISMLRYITDMKLSNDGMLIYYCKSQSDVAFLPALHEIKRQKPEFNISFVIGSGALDQLQGFDALNGTINSASLEKVTAGHFSDRTYFISGSEGFNKRLAKTLESRGVTKDRILINGLSQGQREVKSLRFNVPSKVYVLAGIGLLIGSGVLASKSNNATSSKNLTGSTSNNQNAFGGSGNSRQSQVNQGLNNLQSSGGSITTTSSSSGGSSSSSGSGSSGTGSSGNGSSSSGKGSSGSSSSSGGSSSSSGSGSSGTGSSSSGTGSSSGGSKSVAPVLTLSASATTLTQGNSLSLTWSINGDATAPVTCSASGGWSGTKANSGSQSESPASSTTYTLTCTNSAGSSSKSVSVTVNPPPPLPVAPTLTFSTNTKTITAGQTLTLSWSINSNATAPVTCSASGGWSGTKANSGSQSESPNSSTTYYLGCTNSAGSSSKSIYITVNPACVSTPSFPC